MAHFQVPGPVGSDSGDVGFVLDHAGALDYTGVIGRAGGETQPPGPMSTVLWQKKSQTTRPATAKATKGVRVHPRSQISAQNWVDIIQRSKHVPDYFKPQIKASGDVIHVTSTTRFKVPNNVIMPDWLTDWLSAFFNDEWEMTTGVLDATVTRGDPTKKGDAAKNFIKVVHIPDLGTGESVSGFTRSTMTSEGHSTADIKAERGNTLPTGVTVKSGRKLVVVANRVTLRLGTTVKTLNFEEYEVAEVWFHELACHAGRNSQGLSDVHEPDGRGVPDRCGADIADRFEPSKTVEKMNEEIKNFLK